MNNLAYLAEDALSFLPVSRRVVRAFTGDLALTLRASSNTKWLRRVPVRRGDVRFLGLPIVYLNSLILEIFKAIIAYPI